MSICPVIDLRRPFMPAFANPAYFQIAFGEHLIWCQIAILFCIPLPCKPRKQGAHIVDSRDRTTAPTIGAVQPVRCTVIDFFFPLVPPVTNPSDLVVTVRKILLRAFNVPLQRGHSVPFSRLYTLAGQLYPQVTHVQMTGFRLPLVIWSNVKGAF